MYKRQLLCCAEREDIIPQIFTAEFVIGALATGISRKLLERYAQQAYQNVCRNKNWDEFHDVYLAICTIKQHYSYFEYYDMNYEVNDVSAMQQIYPCLLYTSHIPTSIIRNLWYRRH